MAGMVQSTKIGTAGLAQKVIEEFSDLNGLTAEECLDLGLDANSYQVLTDLLGPGQGGVITCAEKTRMVQSGFSDEFIKTLTGQEMTECHDSLKALQSRVHWLAKYSVTRVFQIDKPDPERVLIIQELGAIGPYAKQAVPVLIEASGDEAEQIRHAAAVALGEIPEMHASVIRLIEAMSEWSPNERGILAEALRKKGAAACPILVSHLVTHPNIPWQMRYTFIEILGRIGKPAAVAGRTIVEADLNHPEPWVRNIAAWALGAMGDERSIPPLIEALSDPVNFVSDAAAIALVKIGTASVQAFTRTLQDRTAKLSARRQSARRMGEIKTEDAEAIRALVQQTGDPDETLSQLATEALIKIGPPAAGILLDSLWNSHASVRRQILRALGEIRPEGEASITIISEFLADPDEEVRQAAAETLGKYGVQAKQSVSLLVLVLNDKAPVLKAVIDALVKIGPDAIPELLAVLQDTREPVRTAAANALVRIGAPAVPALIQKFSIRNEPLHEIVATLLLKIGRPAVPALIDGVDHPVDDVREHCARLLGRIDASEAQQQEAATKILQKLESEKLALHDTFVTSLVNLGKPAIDPLIQELDSPNAAVREDAAHALGEIEREPRKVVPSLVMKLGDVEPVRQAAINALIRFGSVAVNDLVQSLNKEERVRTGAVEALVGIGRPAVHPLMDALSSADAASLALARIGHPAIQPLLRRLRENPPPPDVCQRIAETLARIGVPAIEPLQEAVQENYQNANYTMRLYSALALGFLGPMAVNAHEVLTKVGARERHRVVQKVISDALIKIGHPGVLGLIRQLEDPDPNLRRFAAMTLAEIGPQAKDAIPALIRKLSDDTAVGDEGLLVQAAATQALEAIGPAKPSAWRELLSLLDLGETEVQVGAVNQFAKMANSGEILKRTLHSKRSLMKKLGEMYGNALPDSPLHQALQEALAVLTKG